MHSAAKQFLSGQTVATNPYVRRHLRTYYGGLLAEESIAIFQRYAPQALAYIQSGGPTSTTNPLPTP